MLDFNDTFGAQVACILTGDSRRARILAAPTNHPGTFVSMMGRYQTAIPGRPRIFVAAVNLGNDLDEFSEQMAGARHAQGSFAEWLRGNSFLYMDLLVLRVNAMRGETDFLGINSILFTMTADERVLLVREVSRSLVELMSIIDAEYKVVVIIPSDYQVDAAQFDKYRRYYSDERVFAELRSSVPDYARMMNVLENYLSSRMPQGTIVIRLSKLIEQYPDRFSLFDDSSHHINARAHRMIADAIANRTALIGPLPCTPARLQ
jgi:hypothetical protein